MMVCRACSHWTPRDELWGEVFIAYAKGEFQTAENDIKRSIRIGDDDQQRREKDQRHAQSKNPKGSDREKTTFIVRRSTRDMVRQGVSGDVVKEQAAQRGLKKVGKKEDIFHLILDYDKKLKCDDLPEGEVPASFFARGSQPNLLLRVRLLCPNHSPNTGQIPAKTG